MLKTNFGVGVVFIIAFSILLLRHEVSAMGVGTKLVLFSEVKGIVVNQGKPLARTEVVRTFHWMWNNKEYQDRTKTDELGKFTLPKFSLYSIAANVFPHEPVIHQNITIKVNAKDYKAWVASKRNYDDNGELDGQPINIICDIATKPEDQGKFYGISSLR